MIGFRSAAACCGLAALALASCNLITGVDDLEKVDSLPGGGGAGAGLSDLTSEVVTSRYGTCVVDATRAAYCWGLYPGANGVAFSLTPVRVELPGTVLSIGMGTFHRCAQVGELSADGEKLKTDFYCWGENDRGQLGDGTYETGLAPRLVQGLSGIVFDRFTVGHSHTCAAQKGGGRLFCWGANQHGQLGDGTTQDAQLPIELFADAITGGQGGGAGQGGAGGGAGMPASWNGIQSAGSFHTCATLERDDRNETYCWGSNQFGQLGQPASQGPNPTPVRVNDEVSVIDGFDRFDRVFAGGGHTCARGGGDVKPVYCWGKNDFGQLGDSTTASRHEPVRVNVPKVDTVYTGLDHTCVAVPAPSGNVTLSCWGRNDAGQILVQATDRQPQPAPVQFQGEFSGFSSARSEHSCAFSAGDKSLWCWGRNDAGQLGIGTISEFEREPQLVYRP